MHQRVARALELLRGCHPQHHPGLLLAHQQQLKGKQQQKAPGAQAGGSPSAAAAAAQAPPVPWAAPAVPRGTIQATFSFKGFDEARSAPRLIFIVHFPSASISAHAAQLLAQSPK